MASYRSLKAPKAKGQYSIKKGKGGGGQTRLAIARRAGRGR